MKIEQFPHCYRSCVISPHPTPQGRDASESDAQKFFQGLEIELMCQNLPAVETGLDSPALLTLVWMFIHSFFRPPVACLSWPSLSSPRLPTPCHLAPSLVSFPQPQPWARNHSGSPDPAKKVPSARPMFLYSSLPEWKKGQKKFLESILKVLYRKTTTLFIVSW